MSVEKKLASNPSAGSSTDTAGDVATLRQQVVALQTSNRVPTGMASRMQTKNKSLQNQLYVLQDKQNVLNLLVGGVIEVDDATPKQEVLAFFKNILGIKDSTITDFIKAYRKSEPREYLEHVTLDNGTVKNYHVTAPGVMFVRMESEVLREIALAKARGLGGKRHAERNFKYFVTPMKCEATRATEECHKGRIQKLAKGNKAGRKDKYFARGTGEW